MLNGKNTVPVIHVFLLKQTVAVVEFESFASPQETPIFKHVSTTEEENERVTETSDAESQH